MAKEYPWSHDRKLRLRDETEDPTEVGSAPLPAKKKRNWCKKLKGPHQFEFWKEEQFKLWITLVWHYYKCVGCGKQKFISVKAKK